GINSAGTVVGIWGTGTTGQFMNQSTFIWDSTNGFRNLIDLLSANTGWTALEWALAINNSGQIVGEGIHKGAQHAFVMPPTAGPGSSGQGHVPPLVDSGFLQALAPEAVATAGVPERSPLGADRRDAPAPLLQMLDASTGMTSLTESAGGAVAVLHE